MYATVGGGCRIAGYCVEWYHSILQARGNENAKVWDIHDKVVPTVEIDPRLKPVGSTLLGDAYFLDHHRINMEQHLYYEYLISCNHAHDDDPRR